MKAFEFTARPSAEGPKGLAFLALPKDVSAALGARGRVSVVATVAGQSFRTSVFPDGRGGHQMNFNKAMQAASGVGPGGTVRLRLEVDTEPRTTKPPKDLAAVLAKVPKAKENFTALAPSRQKAYVDWIEEAKRPETRARRVAEAVARLRTGKGFW